MTPKRALDHFKWKFQNKWKPTEQDIEAYNTLAEYVVENSKQQIIDNELFAKMYIYMMGFMLVRYDATFFDEIPQKELHKLLNKSTKQILSDVLDIHNINDFEQVVKKNKIKNHEPMTYKEASENLKIMVNGAINEYSPKHLERI